MYISLKPLRPTQQKFPFLYTIWKWVNSGNNHAHYISQELFWRKNYPEIFISDYKHADSFALLFTNQTSMKLSSYAQILLKSDSNVSRTQTPIMLVSLWGLEMKFGRIFLLWQRINTAFILPKLSKTVTYYRLMSKMHNIDSRITSVPIH